MKLLLSLLMCVSLSVSFAQTQSTNTVLFAQCMIDVEEGQMRSLETDLRSNPYVKLVRLDNASKTMFLLTKNIDQLSEDDLKSWFGVFSSQASCVSIGVYGVDSMLDYPLTNCPEE